MSPSAAPRETPSSGAAPLTGSQREIVFHTRAWAELVREVYGFESVAARVDGGCLPLFHTRSPLLGSKLVSAVFNGYAGPRYDDPATCGVLVEAAAARARDRGVDWLELRCLAELPSDLVRRTGLAVRTPDPLTVLPLGPYAAVEAGYDRKFRKNLRGARRLLGAAGVRVERSLAAEDLRGFHDVLVRAYRDRHGSMAQPWRLFEAVRRRFLEPGRGDLWLARGARGEVLGGALFLTHRGVATGAWGATANVDGRWCLDAVIKDAAIRHYAGRGFELVDFGLSSPRQAGLLFAKSRFGGVTTPTPWYYLPVRAKRIPERDFADAYPWLRRAWRRVPVPVAKQLSAWLAPRLS